MKKIITIMLLLFTLCACSNNKEDSINLNKIIEEGNYIILDVRTKEEYDQNHIVDAINIPHIEIDETIDLDKEKIILVYCQSGGRSKIASELLESLGYTVYNLGGINDVELEKE